MPGVLNEAMIQKRADYTLGQNPPEPQLELHLFVNNRAPLCTDVPADYTECTVGGYAPLVLDPTKWSGGLTACVDTRLYDSATPPVFTFTGGGQTIRGHYVLDNTDGSVAWAELWEVPFVTFNGGQVFVTLQWIDQQCAP